LVECFDQKVRQLAPQVYDFSVREAFSSYQIALDTDASDSKVREGVVFDAWLDHIKVIDSKFLSADGEDPLLLYTIFLSGMVNDFSSTFLLISIEYLKFLRLSESPDYDATYEKTMDAMDTLIVYVTKAKWEVVENWTKEMHAMPCRNGQSLSDELKAWEDAFYPEYLEPIEEYKDTIEMAFVTGLPDPSDFSEEDTAVEESEPALLRMSAPVVVEDDDVECSVPVLSVDHKSGAKGKYFNFDKNALDAALGRQDWSGERLTLRDGMKVAVWRSANGGSVGDAHGRKDDSAKEGDWSTGDKLLVC